MKKQLSIALLGFSLSVLSSNILAADTAELSKEDKLSSSILATDDKVELSKEDKLSYSFGFSIGRSAKVQELTVNEETFLKGFQDAQAGEAKLMQEDEIVQVLTGHQKERLAKKMAEKSAKAGKAKAAGEAFLAENAKKDGVTVLESGLQYKVVTSGKGKTPKSTDKVKTHYEGTLLDGTVFDSSYKRDEPASFPVNGVIKGWQEALPLMKEGDIWMLYIPADLAYGSRGAGASIGADETLTFKIELIEVLDK